MHKRMAVLISVPIALGSLYLNGCTVVTVGAHEKPPRIQMDGWVTAYAAAKGIRPWDSTIVKLDIMSHDEVISAEVWPLASAGIGAVGARLQVVPFEIAAGTLFYHPKPIDYWTRKEPESKPQPAQPEKNENAPAPSAAE